ncbi:MAG: NapC/NirT family cytochrome c [Ignavibacteriales bacterium]|nr:NapC/NirT family cytochrome c [Ignavibacteriales bacterium]
MVRKKIIFLSISAVIIFTASTIVILDERYGKFQYDDFEKPAYCGSCHTHFYQQWKQAMMSQAYTHHWDEIEYFDLAVPHADINPQYSLLKAECNGCHSPLSYLAGDTPPPRPEKNSRANESVSCDVCHLITGYEGDTPYNFNYIIQPGKTKFSSRLPGVESPNHKIEVTDIHHKGDFCGICHNEKNGFDIWVKSTHLEWKEGPYYKEGVQCQDCHMPKTEFSTALMGKIFADARLHLFNGAHDNGKLRGTIEIKIYPDIDEAEPGEKVKFTITLFNQKTGHKFPTGSVEDRIVWLHLEAIDEKGNVYHLPVDKKGFEGEKWTIGSNDLEYQDIGIAKGISNFAGIQRDGVPIGDRIFRMPYFDPNGNMTILQWNTKSLGVDYRIGPRETITETYSFNIPDKVEIGKLRIIATLNYQKLVKPVADFLNVPDDESEIVKINEQSIEIEIVD